MNGNNMPIPHRTQAFNQELSAEVARLKTQLVEAKSSAPLQTESSPIYVSCNGVEFPKISAAIQELEKESDALIALLKN